MTIRRTFLLLVVPLFLLLAGVNGALLFLWERGEAAKGLENQALAAAVTTAAFAASHEDLARALGEPRRAAAIRAAAVSITGLDGLYLARPGEAPHRVAGEGRNASLDAWPAPAQATALPIRANAAGHRVATALAPAAEGAFVIAQIDAEPLFAQVDGLKRLIAGLVVVAGLLGFVLAWTLASRIRGELARNSAMIAAIRADGPPVSDEGLAIRETRDLAEAVRLMRTSVAGRVARSQRELANHDRRRDEAVAVAAYSEAALPMLTTSAAGARVAARALGEASPGGFHALSVHAGRAALVLGEAQADTPASALALALAARRYFERTPVDNAAVERACRAFGLLRVDWRAWTESDTPAAGQVLALLDGDNAERAAAYAARGPDLPPEGLVNDLAVLLQANGLVAVVRRA